MKALGLTFYYFLEIYETSCSDERNVRALTTVGSRPVVFDQWMERKLKTHIGIENLERISTREVVP